METLISRSRAFILFSVTLFTGMSLFGASSHPASPEIYRSSQTMRGAAAVYYWFEPGPAQIEWHVTISPSGPTSNHVMLLLSAPDRTVLVEKQIVDLSKQQKRPYATHEVLKFDVPVRGMYKLEMIPHERDSGMNMTWYAHASTPLFMIEPAGLHGDREYIPIIVQNPGHSGQISFMGTPNSQQLELTTSNSRLREVHIYQGDNEQPFQIVNFSPNQRNHNITLPASPNQLWTVLFDQQDIRIHVDEVTRWKEVKNDGFENTGYYTFSPESYFPAKALRWMLTPQRYTLPKSDTPHTVKFKIHNEFSSRRQFSINLESSISGASLSENDLELDSQESQEISVTVPGSSEGTLLIKVRVNGESTGETYARINIIPAVSGKLPNPLVLKPYQHENSLFGYHPEFTPLAPDFNFQNQPFIRKVDHERHSFHGIEWNDGQQWQTLNVDQFLAEQLPDHSILLAGGFMGNRTSFDEDGNWYSLLHTLNAKQQQTVVLLTGNQDGSNTSLHPIVTEGRYAFDLETQLGHNKWQGPPAFLLWTRSADHPARWGQVNRLQLWIPQIQNEQLVIGEPILISDASIGWAAHSGGGSAIATRDGITHVVWGEAVDSGTDVPGVPTYITSVNHETREVGEPVFLGYAPPINDVHNSPALVIDSKGYLHVVTGAHGASFLYRRSLHPNRIDQGWTESEKVLHHGRMEDNGTERGAQTYVGLICDDQDRLHLVSRQWRRKIDPYFEGSIYAALSYQYKDPDQPWSQARPLVVPSLPNYSVYYHKLTRDRLGNPYLSYAYLTIHKTYRADLSGRFNHRTLISTTDRGETWQLVDSALIEERIQ